MRSKEGLYLLTETELRTWLGRYRQDLRYDGESPPYGHAATKWARSLCGEIVRELVGRWAAQRKKEPRQNRELPRLSNHDTRHQQEI